MELIKLHRPNPLALVRYVEGYRKGYKCITLWNDKDGLMQTDYSFITYTPENRVGKGTNPFIE